MPGGGEDFLLDTKSNQSKDMERPVTVTADVYLKDSEELDLDGIRIKVRATPGHTRAKISCYFPEGGFLICGDTLFQESVGRTDFPTGSIVRWCVLCEGEVVYSAGGYGSLSGTPPTTIGHEKKYNPFCNRVLNSYNTEIYSGTERLISVPV